MNLITYQATTQNQRQQIQNWSAEQLADHQLNYFNHMLREVLPGNEFYATKFGNSQLQLADLDELNQLPFTFKNELMNDENSTGFARNLTYPIDQYCRFHRTSGTQGRPMIVLDTQQDWDWWIETWQYVLDVAELAAEDRVLMAFSFGPFIGFWSAYDAALSRQSMVLPTGSMSSVDRLELMRSIDATVLFCTPSYALHLAEIAENNQIVISNLKINRIVVAGEPGGSIPAIRNRIESAWGARVIDHSGASEVGPWGFADPAGRGIYINEAQFIAEFISIQNGEPADEGELSELVLTTLGRFGSPVVRFRTGDLVKPTWNDDQSGSFVLLDGGVLGRTDNMLIIRGVNVFPTSIEQILRGFPEVVEYRMTAFQTSSMDQLKIEIEDRLENPDRVKDELRLRLGLRVDVRCVPAGSLPRFESKGKRFIDQR